MHATANHVGETRAVAGGGLTPADQKVDARTVFDPPANCRLTRNAKPFAGAENLTDET